MILGLRHTGVVVKDMTTALTFYRDLLGLSMVKDYVEEGLFIEKLVGVPGAKLRIVKLVTAQPPDKKVGALPVAYPGMVELLQFLEPSNESISAEKRHRLGISHLAFAIDNAERTYQEFSKHGVVFNHPPQLSPDGGAKVAYAHDPDGTTIELVEMMGAK